MNSSSVDGWSSVLAIYTCENRCAKYIAVSRINFYAKSFHSRDKEALNIRS